jgi:hypothetical protein
MHRDYFSSGLIGAALILSIAIAWLAILVPSHAAPSLRADTKSIDIGAAVSIVGNPLRKGDRLDVERGKIKDAARSAPTPGGKAGARIPIGCEVAFNKLGGSGHVAVRCITGIEASVKLARAANHDRALA